METFPSLAELPQNRDSGASRVCGAQAKNFRGPLQHGNNYLIDYLKATKDKEHKSQTININSKTIRRKKLSNNYNLK